MSKRIFSLILAAVMVFSLLPVFASAAGENAQQVADDKNVLSPGEMTTDSMVTNKWLTENGNAYDLTMSAYATGGTMTQELESDVPLDIVLVIDQSGSMLNADMATGGYVSAGNKAWTVSQAVGYYVKDGNNYYKLEADRGTIYTGRVHPYLSDDLLGTSGGEDWHTGWVSRETGYYVVDENNGSPRMTKLYSRSYGYVGGYDCQFYYYDASGNVHYIPFNSANGSTTASYSRSGWTLGTGSMNSNSNRLWTTVYWLSSAESYNQLYYKKGTEKVNLGPEVTYDNQTVYSGELYYYSDANQSRLDALKQAAGQFAEMVGERADMANVDHRIAVVGFASNMQPYPSTAKSNIIGDNEYHYVNTGMFINGEFKNYGAPQTGSAIASSNSTRYQNGVYYYQPHNSSTRYPIRYLSTQHGFSSDGWHYMYKNNNDKYAFQSGAITQNSNGTWPGTWYPVTFNYLQNTDYQQAFENVRENDASGTYAGNKVNNDIDKALDTINAYGGTYVSYGMSMANQIFENNPIGANENRKRIVVVFTDGEPGSGLQDPAFEDAIAGEALADAAIMKDKYGATVYTIGLFVNKNGSSTVSQDAVDFIHNLSSEKYVTSTPVYADDLDPSKTYYYVDKNGKTNAATTVDSNGISLLAGWADDGQGGFYYYTTDRYYFFDMNYNYPQYLNVGQRYYAVLKSTYNSNNYSVEYNCKNYGKLCTWEYKWNNAEDALADPATGPEDTNGYVFHELGELQNGKEGTYAFQAADVGGLTAAFKTISESIQTPYTTVSLNAENSVLRDVITSHFSVNTDKTQNPVTFSLEYSAGDPANFTAVTNPNADEQAILNGITYSWVTNADGSKTLDVKGFDYSKWFVAEGHPGYKLIATVHGLTTNELGKLYSNESSSGVYKDDSMVAPLPMPYITKEADGSATYVMDFGAKMKIAEEAKFQVNVTNVPGSNGTFFKDADADAEGAISYQLKNTTVSGTGSREGQSATNLTPFTGSDKVTIHGRFYPTDRSASDKTADAAASWKDVTVVPASSVYFDDSFNTNNTVLTVGDGSGYNVDVNASTAVQKDAATGNTYLFYTFNGTGIDVYCTTSGTGESIRAALYSGGIDDTASIENRVGDMVNMRNYSKDPRYNVPSIHFMVEDYNQYTLMLLIPAGVNYQLDGVRVYNPMGTGAQTIYEDTSENNAQYTNLHACLVGKDKGYTVTDPFDGTEEETASGVLFIDDVAKLSNLTYDTFFDAYQAQGPENEIYLNPGQAITFALDGVSGTDRFWIGLSAPDAASNASGAVSVNSDDANITVTSPVDMYYPITELIGDEGSVTITNRGESLISVTNLKYTQVKPEQGGQAKALFAPVTMKSLKLAANNGVDPDAVVTPDPTQPPTITEVIRTLISTFVNALFGSIARLFGH